MHIALIAMPWNARRMPSPALGILAAYLRQRTAHAVDCLHEFVHVSLSLGALYDPISSADLIGEVVYAAHLHPDRLDAARRSYAEWENQQRSLLKFRRDDRDAWADGDAEGHFEQVYQATGAHINALVDRIAGQYDVLAFTTSFCQLFASLAVARRLKARESGAPIVLGGAAVAGDAGPAVLRTYPFVDHAIQSGGEHRFSSLLDRIEASRPPSGRSSGVLSRADLPGSAPSAGAPVTRAEIESLDDFPPPDFGEYHELVEKYGLPRWSIPIEGARGCEPDRAEAGAGPNALTSGTTPPLPRRKAVDRLAAEMQAQCERYEVPRFLFLDGSPLRADAGSLATAVKDLGKSLRFFHNIDPTIHPHDLLHLWEAGCLGVDMRIEGLSTRYLRRMGMSTSTIENLQAMRVCYELGINHGSQLVTDFPGSTQEEVHETVHNVRRFAIVYQPLDSRRFRLCTDSPIAEEPALSGLTNIRTADEFRRVLAPDVWPSLKLRWLDFDAAGEPADWTPLREVQAHWRDLHRRLLLLDGVEWFIGTRPLYYYDGGTFLRIFDRREGCEEITLDWLMRGIYLNCMQIRSREQIERRFAGRCTRRESDEVLAEFLEHDLMFAEDDKVLSLAVAFRVELATERIKKAWAEDAAAESPAANAG